MGYTQTPPTWHLWCGIWASSCCSVSCKSWQSLPCSPKAKACIRLKRKTMGVSLTSMKPGPENQCEQKCLGVSNPAKRCTRMEWPQQKLVTRDMWWWWWYIYILFNMCILLYIAIVMRKMGEFSLLRPHHLERIPGRPCTLRSLKTSRSSTSMTSQGRRKQNIWKTSPPLNPCP